MDAYTDSHDVRHDVFEDWKLFGRVCSDYEWQLENGQDEVDPLLDLEWLFPEKHDDEEQREKDAAID